MATEFRSGFGFQAGEWIDDSRAPALNSFPVCMVWSFSSKNPMATACDGGFSGVCGARSIE